MPHTKLFETNTIPVRGWVGVAVGLKPVDPVADAIRSLTPAQLADWRQMWQSACRLTGQRGTLHDFLRAHIGGFLAKIEREPGRWSWDGGMFLRGKA